MNFIDRIYTKFRHKLTKCPLCDIISQSEVKDYMADEQTQLEQKIKDEINNLLSTMLKTGKHKDLIIRQFKNRLSFLQWVNQNWKLRDQKVPRVVKQKEIFFCHLGENIGSEQNGKRPVVVVQNNIGNSMGNTTIVVPITTYENSSFYLKDNERYMSYTLPDGSTKERKLDFYEVEIQVESNAKYPVHGIANVVHMREVSKKRLTNSPVAKVTDDTYNSIIKAINQNLSIL